MASRTTVDILHDLKNYYYIGNYEKCLIEVNRLEIESMEKTIFMYRAYIALNKLDVVMGTIDEDETTSLLALRYMAEYYSDDEKRMDIIQRLDDKFDNDLDSFGSVWRIIGATLYYNENLYDSALRLLGNSHYAECLALRVLCLLQIAQFEKAQKITEIMEQAYENHILTALCKVWLNMHMGGINYNIAFTILKMICKKYGRSPQIINNMAVCMMGQKRYEQAKLLLVDCFNTEPRNREIVTNLYFVSQYLGEKCEGVHKFLQSLRKPQLKRRFTRKEDNGTGNACVCYSSNINT